MAGVGRKTTAHLLELGLITDPDRVQHSRPRERPLRASGRLEQPRQETDRCARCAKEIRGFETISVTGKGEFCYPCFNQDLSARVGLQFDNAQLEPVTLHDLAAKPHTFWIRSMLVGEGLGRA